MRLILTIKHQAQAEGLHLSFPLSLHLSFNSASLFLPPFSFLSPFLYLNNPEAWTHYTGEIDTLWNSPLLILLACKTSDFCISRLDSTLRMTTEKMTSDSLQFTHILKNITFKPPFFKDLRNVCGLQEKLVSLLQERGMINIQGFLCFKKTGHFLFFQVNWLLKRMSFQWLHSLQGCTCLGFTLTNQKRRWTNRQMGGERKREATQEEG